MAGPVPLMSQGHNDQQFGYEGAQLHFVISLACFSFETLKMQAFLFFFSFFFLACVPKGKSWSHTFLAETVETGDKNRIIAKAVHRNLQEMSSFS